MLGFLTSECAELEEEITRLENKDSSGESTLELTRELGDIIFDTMLLAIACEREFNVDLQHCVDIAAQKVEGRTPYMLWGAQFTRDVTLKRTKTMWQEQKALAKSGEVTARDRRPLRFLRPAQRHKHELLLLAGFSIGFCFGYAWSFS